MLSDILFVSDLHGDLYGQPNTLASFILDEELLARVVHACQWEAERWALGYDLGEREIRTLVKSVYHLYATQHGTFALPKCHDVMMTGFRFRFHLKASHTHARARKKPFRCWAMPLNPVLTTAGSGPNACTV